MKRKKLNARQKMRLLKLAKIRASKIPKGKGLIKNRPAGRKIYGK